MDDLKLFAPNDENLMEQLRLVKRYSNDGKCAKCTFVEGRATKTDNIKIDLDTTIQELENEASYKYLGVEEGH